MPRTAKKTGTGKRWTPAQKRKFKRTMALKREQRRLGRQVNDAMPPRDHPLAGRLEGPLASPLEGPLASVGANGTVGPARRVEEVVNALESLTLTDLRSLAESVDLRERVKSLLPGLEAIVR